MNELAGHAEGDLVGEGRGVVARLVPREQNAVRPRGHGELLQPADCLVESVVEDMPAVDLDLNGVGNRGHCSVFLRVLLVGPNGFRNHNVIFIASSSFSAASVRRGNPAGSRCWLLTCGSNPELVPMVKAVTLDVLGRASRVKDGRNAVVRRRPPHVRCPSAARTKAVIFSKDLYPLH